MTFEEASELKAKIGDKIIKADIEYDVFVVPDLQEDFLSYSQDYDPEDLIDEMAKLYSSNNEFRVIGLCWDEGNMLTYNLTE